MTTGAAAMLNQLDRFKEAKSLLRKAAPVARRVFGDSHDVTIKLRQLYGRVLYRDDGATLDDLREAVTTLESVANSWKQVFGQAHPETPMVQGALEMARKTLARATAASESKAPP